MKRVIFSLMILVFVIVPGCRNNQQDYSETESPYISSPDIPGPDTFTELIEFSIYHKSIQNISDQAWRDFIHQTYNIQLNPVLQIADDGLKELTSLLESKNLQGLFSLYNGEFNSLFADINEYAIPVNDYLEDNDIWQSLPDDYKSAAEIGGDIWAIPMQYKPYGDQMRLRIYNRDILNQIGKEKPASTSDFYELVKSVYESKIVDYVIPIERNNPFYTLYDIFWTYEIPISCTDTIVTAIQYDYEQGMFRDYAEDDAMREAIDFIRQLYTMNIINMPADNADPGILFNLGKAFTLQNMIYDRQKISNVEYDFTFLLDDGKNIRIPVNKTSGMYILLKETAKPDIIVNRLINAFLNSEEANISAYLGDDKSKYTTRPDVIIYDGNLYRDAPAIFRNIVMDKAVIAKSYEPGSYEEQYSSFINNVNPDRFLGVNPYFDYLGKSNKDISTLFNQYFVGIFDSTASVDDIYAAYNTAMLKSNAAEYIDSLNEIINAH